PERRAGRVLRGVAAVLALVWLGAPNWPEQIDDQLITLAFAHAWAETGQIRWGTGEVVEACSSFLQLSLATGWIALGGGDANVFVKVLAALAGVAMTLYANARLPLTVAGSLVLAALVGWEPTARWSFVGMETSLYALLLTVGWAGVLGAAPGTVGGLGALWLAATAHPEGNLHFALGALVALRTPGREWRERREWRAAVAFGAALALYHGLRVSAYGAFLPTPFLVKVAANSPFGDQWGQFGWETVTLVGIAAALVSGYRVRALALLPVCVQIAVELRAEPDWMGHARHLLPGVWATAVAWASTAEARPGGWRAMGVVALVLGASLLQPPDHALPRPTLRTEGVLVSPLRWFTSALDTTQREDVVIITEGTPMGGTVVAEDVGMPGNIPGVRVIDLVGLATRDVALAALGDEEADDSLRRRFQGPPDRPVLVRRMVYAADELARPVPWVRLPSATRVIYPQGTALWYRLSSVRPSDEEVAARWRAMHARYPSQGPVAWYHALAEAELGRLVEAAAVADRMVRRFPGDALMGTLPSAVFAPFPIESYAEPPEGLRQVSRLIPRALAGRLALVVGVEPNDDAGQVVHVSWSCGGAV
ncbi:MAG: hypothetical protein ACK4YP_20255, partial [Myxococcota bacterium]